MPFSEFSNNPLMTRRDLITAALALIQPLHQYKSIHRARIKVATATGSGFSETAAQLEGFARPLWVVADILRQANDGVLDQSSSVVHLEDWVVGLKAGTDPYSSEYWGDVLDFDQRMVEMESIAYALLTHPEAFAFGKDEKARINLVSWLQQINHRKMPQTNWLWFRVLVNLALVKTLGVQLQEVKEHIDLSLKTLDTFYIADGWNSDGLWCKERQQADYYSGSFAIQFAQLLFVRFAPEYDPQRTERYKQQAREFAREYWRYFAPNGAAIPFGRSLTYRFACAAFFAAICVVDIDLPSPICCFGSAKGLLLRHIRWWSHQSSVFNTDGTLSIGYVYPNMHLAEDYNSPQSVYWCLKAMIVINLDEGHPFWTSEERPHPQLQEGHFFSKVHALRPPRHLLCNRPEHSFLLSSGQSTSKAFRAREAKYGKFAYSSSYGFSVPCGPSLEETAPDSTLAVSLDNGETLQWRVRDAPFDEKFEEVKVGEQQTTTLVSRWKPWKLIPLVVETRLVPPLEKYPGWSLRIHALRWIEQPSDTPTILFVDGGFAISTQTSAGESVFEKPLAVMCEKQPTNLSEGGWWSDSRSSLIFSEAGVSGILDLTPQSSGFVQSTSTIIRASPNT